jgi:hypothetical protein
MCELRPDPETQADPPPDRRSMSRTEHKSLQGTTEPTFEAAVETKDVAGPADEAEPTVRFHVTNWTHDHQGKLLTPEDEVELPVSLAEKLTPVYGRIVTD